MLDGHIITIITPKTVTFSDEDPERTPRPTTRQHVFDIGEDPLPAFSWPPPRRTGWERDYQR